MVSNYMDNEKKNALKLLGFKIVIKTNLKITNFLDVALNLEKGTFKPFKKCKWHSYLHTHILKPPTLNHQTNTLAVDYQTTNPISTYLTAKKTYTTTH